MNLSNPTTDAAVSPIVAANSRDFGTIPMVPSLDFEPPLSPIELEMRFGEPVIHDLVDYSRLAHLYRQALFVERADPHFVQWDAIPLRDFAKKAESSAIHYAHRLLTMRDSYFVANGSSRGFHAWLQRKHGYDQADKTLRRQICHARMSLILAARGRIESLPGQNVSGVIAGLLPRCTWADFLTAFPVKHCGKTGLQKKICMFSEETNIPLRLTPSPNIPIPGLPDDNHPPVLPEPDGMPGQECPTPISASPPDLEKPTKKVPLAEKIAPDMAGFCPHYWLERQTSAHLAKRILKGLRVKIKAVPRPAWKEQRLALHAVIAKHDPLLAEKITQTALLLLYDKIAKEYCQPRQKISPTAEHKG